MKYLLLSFLLVLSCAPTAHASIAFDKNVPKNTQIRLRNTYNALPWQARLGDVTVRLGSLRKGVAGTYSIDQDLITLVPGYAIPYYFAHEMGHHVKDDVFSPQQSADWNAFWKENRAKMPNYYAKKTPEEGFAEVFTNTYSTKWFTLSPLIKQKMQSYFK